MMRPLSLALVWFSLVPMIAAGSDLRVSDCINALDAHPVHACGHRDQSERHFFQSRWKCFANACADLS